MQKHEILTQYKKKGADVLWIPALELYLHCILFHGEILRQQIQRTMGTDRAAQMMMMIKEKEVCLGLSGLWIATSSFSIS